MFNKVKKITKLLKGKEIDFDMFKETEVNANDTVINYELDDKVDKFITWYYLNMIKDNYAGMGQVYMLNDMRNFIEKVAVFYELKYPDYVIEDIMNNDKTSNKEDIKYNTHEFINDLPGDEKFYFQRPRYSNVVYFGKYLSHVRLSSRGTVIASKRIHLIDSSLEDTDIIGKNIKEVYNRLQLDEIDSSLYSNVLKAINDYDNLVYQKDEMLDAIMYRIIERGFNRFGPRRGLLFALEFDRNIDIPMIYGVDISDPYLNEFIDFYLKSGGKEDLLCLENYFFRNFKNEPLHTISLDKVRSLKSIYSEVKKKKLYQRLVNDLANYIDKDEMVKVKRIERKLKNNVKKM